MRKKKKKKISISRGSCLFKERKKKKKEKNHLASSITQVHLVTFSNCVDEHEMMSGFLVLDWPGRVSCQEDTDVVNQQLDVEVRQSLYCQLVPWPFDKDKED